MNSYSFLKYKFVQILLLFLGISADPLVGSIAAQYVSNREEHDKTAREWTRRYATWIKIITYWSLLIFVNSSDVRTKTPQDSIDLILQRTGLNCMLFCVAVNEEKFKKSVEIAPWELGGKKFMTLSPVSTRRFSSPSCFVHIRQMNDLVAFIDGRYNARYVLEWKLNAFAAI